MPIDPADVLRLVMPQWQGGDNPAYRIGSGVLAALVPDARGPVVTVNVPPAGRRERQPTNGIRSRDALLDILRETGAAISSHEPAGIVTLGGDCLVDLAPMPT